MKKSICIILFVTSFLVAGEKNIQEKTIVNNPVLDNDYRDLRTGDYGMVCQNEDGSYNPDMENYLYSPVINVPSGTEVSVDFLVRGSLLDGDAFPNVDYWGLQITPDAGVNWYYVSNPYGADDGDNYVYSDAPEVWSLFSTVYSEPIDIDNYNNTDIQLRYWFHSDSDAPQGEGLFLDDISVNVDGTDIYFESFEDSTMAGWVSVDQTSTDPAWHQDTYGAYGNSGQSWWMGDPTIGPNGGYLNHWYQVLDTPPISIPAGTNTYTVAFDQKRAIEGLCVGTGCPGCPDDASTTLYDGWDAFHIRISADGGTTWEILDDASPAYNTTDTYCFGYEFNEGCGIPGWGGPETATPTWESTVLNIPQSYNGQEVLIRFAFASDPGYDTETNGDLTGVWVDNINVAGGVFTNDGEDATGFESKSLVALGGDLWHVDFTGVPPVIPMPQNVSVVANDGFIEVNWDAPAGGGQTYTNEWVDFDDGTFENAITVTEGQGYLGNYFGMPYGVQSVTVHSARVWASNAGTTTLAGFAVIGGVPSPTPLYTLSINTNAESFTNEIVLDGWEFQSSFVIAMMVTDVIGLGIDYNGSPSAASWSNIGGWDPWSDVAANVDGLEDGEFGVQAKITSVGGATPVFNVYRDPGINGSFQLMFNGMEQDETSYTDNIVTNGTEYCYSITSVYDDGTESLESDFTVLQCGTPISNTVYEITYDDGEHDEVFPIPSGDYLATKFTPDGYPSDVYSVDFYLPNNENGTVLLYVWDDDGVNGLPGTPIIEGFPYLMIQGWNSFNFVNEGFPAITITDGSFYVGFQQFNDGLSMGIDADNASNSSNSIVKLTSFGSDWGPLNDWSPGGVWMLRTQIDNENAIMNIEKNENLQIPESFSLAQNYPNPFNPSTKIEFSVSEIANINLEIFDILGKNIQTVVDKSMDPGFYKFNISMDGIASGMYFYRLVAVNQSGNIIHNQMRKMILMR